MLRTLVCVALALLIFVGGVLAADGTVVKLDKGKLTVKVGDKEQEIALKGVVIKDAGGGEVKGKAGRELLKEGTKVELVEKDGKVVEIKIK